MESTLYFARALEFFEGIKNVFGIACGSVVWREACPCSYSRFSFADVPICDPLVIAPGPKRPIPGKELTNVVGGLPKEITKRSLTPLIKLRKTLAFDGISELFRAGRNDIAKLSEYCLTTPFTRFPK